MLFCCISTLCLSVFVSYYVSHKDLAVYWGRILLNGAVFPKNVFLLTSLLLSL